jgi:KDO2-lipid IV(A) lauroyltransferase
MRQTVGRALLLCAATTIAGFGSLTWANNPGLASLGQVCATGIGCLALVALGLLPDWWQQWSRNRPVSPGHRNSPHPAARPFAPSVVYHGAMWRTGLVVARILPPPVAENLGATAAGLYALLHPRRRRVVAENLTPVLDGNASQAQACALRLFRQFGRKMAALLRHESGAPMPYTPADWSGWEHLEQARGRGQGVLLVTLHLGDWEFGGALLARLGIPLLVLTQAEPGSGFTELRQAARRREGISTVVVGSDPFAFIEVVRRLQEGALVALLIDRPQPAGAVEVTLFNRPFRASIAAADLARATGCCLLPVYVIRTRHGCAAHVLPEIPYQRADLGNREARRLLTAGLLQAFEPAIRQHPDQWYHFIPLWPDALHPPVTAQSAVPPQTTKAAR